MMRKRIRPRMIAPTMAARTPPAESVGAARWGCRKDPQAESAYRRHRSRSRCGNRRPPREVCGMHLFGKAEMLDVEQDCLVNVIHDVANTHGGHVVLLSSRVATPS